MVGRCAVKFGGGGRRAAGHGDGAAPNFADRRRPTANAASTVARPAARLASCRTSSLHPFVVDSKQSNAVTARRYRHDVLEQTTTRTSMSL